MRMRGQISVDFLVGISVVILIFLVLMGYVSQRQREVSGAMVMLNAKKVCRDLAGSINHVYLSGDNTVKEITLPVALRGGKNYTIKIYPRAVVVVALDEGGVQGNAYPCSTLVRKICTPNTAPPPLTSCAEGMAPLVLADSLTLGDIDLGKNIIITYEDDEIILKN